MARHTRARPCQRRDVFVIAIGLWLLTGSFLPRVEDPWPDTIGLDFPFTLSGACAALAAMVHFEAPPAKRSGSSKKQSRRLLHWDFDLRGFANQCSRLRNMKFIVRGGPGPLTCAIVCLMAGVVAHLIGPDSGPIYVIALGVGAIALAFNLAPEALRRSGQAGQGRRERGEGSAR